MINRETFVRLAAGSLFLILYSGGVSAAGYEVARTHFCNELQEEYDQAKTSRNMKDVLLRRGLIRSYCKGHGAYQQAVREAPHGAPHKGTGIERQMVDRHMECRRLMNAKFSFSAAVALLGELHPESDTAQCSADLERKVGVLIAYDTPGVRSILRGQKDTLAIELQQVTSRKGGRPDKVVSNVDLLGCELKLRLTGADRVNTIYDQAIFDGRTGQCKLFSNRGELRSYEDGPYIWVLTVARTG